MTTLPAWINNLFSCCQTGPSNLSAYETTYGSRSFEKASTPLRPPTAMGRITKFTPSVRKESTLSSAQGMDVPKRPIVMAKVALDPTGALARSKLEATTEGPRRLDTNQSSYLETPSTRSPSFSYSRTWSTSSQTSSKSQGPAAAAVTSSETERSQAGSTSEAKVSDQTSSKSQETTPASVGEQLPATSSKTEPLKEEGISKAKTSTPTSPYPAGHPFEEPIPMATIMKTYIRRIPPRPNNIEKPIPLTTHLKLDIPAFENASYLSQDAARLRPTETFVSMPIDTPSVKSPSSQDALTKSDDTERLLPTETFVSMPVDAPAVNSSASQDGLSKSEDVARLLPTETFVSIPIDTPSVKSSNSQDGLSKSNLATLVTGLAALLIGGIAFATKKDAEVEEPEFREDSLDLVDYELAHPGDGPREVTEQAIAARKEEIRQEFENLANRLRSSDVSPEELKEITEQLALDKYLGISILTDDEGNRTARCNPEFVNKTVGDELRAQAQLEYTEARAAYEAQQAAQQKAQEHKGETNELKASFKDSFKDAFNEFQQSSGYTVLASVLLTSGGIATLAAGARLLQKQYTEVLPGTTKHGGGQP